MSKSSRHSRIKKFVLCFSVVISLVFCNFGIFAVRASANAVQHPGSNVELFTIGAPCDISFYQFKHEPITGIIREDTYFGYIPNANVYEWNSETGAANWYSGVLDQDDEVDSLFWFDYEPVSNHPGMFLHFKNLTEADFVINTPVVFRSWDHLISNYDFNIRVLDIKSSIDGGAYIFDQLTVFYELTFLAPSVIDPSVLEPRTRTYHYDMDFNSSGYTIVRYFDSRIFNQSLLDDWAVFTATDGLDYCYLLQARLSFTGAASTLYYIEGNNKYTYDGLKNYTDERIASIYSASEIGDITYDFEDISWSGWLVNAVGGFLDLEIVPGLSFAGMLGLLVGMSLFIVFLKIFAGG